MTAPHLILAKQQLSTDVFLIRVQAPHIARERRPGQFIMLSLDAEFGERLPLTITDADPAAGWIALLFQRVGQGTNMLAELRVGDAIPVLVGPLGQPTHLEKVGTVVCVGGGIGIAPLFPIAQGLKKVGNHVISIIGARTKELVILEDRMREVSDELFVCTDDGSYGTKSLVTAPLKAVCERQPKPELAVAIGPAIMMKFCAETTRPFGVRTLVSLNTIMVDGTGMCGGCRVTVGGKTKFVCVDGPEFDGHQVDFDGMMKRQLAFRSQEQEALAQWRQTHACKLAAAADAARATG
jgi:ferredoxin--NADP+ reductase